jgi:site-specific recombinase XerD
LHDLIPLDLALPGTLSIAEIDATMAYAEASKAASTLASYNSDWKQFAVWCHARGATPLPCHVGILGVFLSHMAQSGRKASSIGRMTAAIAHFHKQAGYEPPTSQEAVKAVMRGIRRTIGTAPTRKAAATHDLVRAMLDCCPNTLIGIRDRALLALGFAGAFRRSELVALLVSDLVEVPDGFRITIRRSKTDQTGEGVEIVIPRGHKIRPVEAVQTWLAASGITDGHLFRAMHRSGVVRSGPPRGHDVALRIKLYAKKAGLDPRVFSGHSLRAGLITSAAEAGASILKIQEVSRHRSVDVLSGYVRRSDLFREHCAASFI